MDWSVRLRLAWQVLRGYPMVDDRPLPTAEEWDNYLSVQVEKLHPAPGDLLVFRMERSLSGDYARRLRDGALGLVAKFPGVEAVVVEPDLEIAVKEAVPQ